jgi:hypothetical protein
MSVMSFAATFFIVFSAIYFPLHFISLICFWLRRNVQPIKARSPEIAAAQSALLFLYALILCLQQALQVILPIPCLLNANAPVPYFSDFSL